MTGLTVVSLFDGIGGFPLAFQRAGVETVATVEIDTAAAAISHRHFPAAAQFDDVKQVTADDFRAAGFVADRGIVTAGWPCQDFSVAGRRAGLDGARSGLWWEVQRLLDELRPAWFVGENVPGLLSSVCDPECENGCMATHGGAFGAVLGSLAELGYGVAYRVLDAQHFGVPQRRQRVFIVGHLGEPWTAPAQVLLEPESGGRDSAAGRAARSGAADGAATGAESAGSDVASTLLGGGKRGYRIDAESAAGGHLIVQPLAVRGRDGGAQLEIGPEGGPYNALRAGDGASSRQPLVCITGDRTHALTSEGADASEDGTGRGTPIVAVNENQRGEIGKPGQGYPCISLAVAGDFSSSEGIAQTVRAAHGQPGVVSTETVVRRLTELECERLQGYPANWTARQSGAARYRQLGNSVAVPVVEWIARRLVTVDQQVTADG